MFLGLALFEISNFFPVFSCTSLLTSSTSDTKRKTSFDFENYLHLTPVLFHQNETFVFKVLLVCKLEMFGKMRFTSSDCNQGVCSERIVSGIYLVSFAVRLKNR